MPRTLYSIQPRERTWKQNHPTQWHDAVNEKMLDPIAGSPATTKSVAGIILLFVDDLFETWHVLRFSCAKSTKRTISCDVCEKSTY